MSRYISGLKGRMLLTVGFAIGPLLCATAYALLRIADHFAFAVIYILLLALFALSAIWLGVKLFVTRPLGELATTAERLCTGAPVSTEHFQTDAVEINTVATALNKMASALARISRAHKLLSETKRAVVNTTDELALLPEMCRLVVTQVGYRGSYIVYAGDDDKRLLRPMAHEGVVGGLTALKQILTDVSWAIGRGPVATTIRTGKPYVAQHLMTDPNFVPWREDAKRNGVASAVVFPIFVEHRVIGALAIYAVEPDAFETTELGLLAEAVHDLSFGIALLRAHAEQGRANATIERMANYDRLTNLPNHTLFEQHLHRALSEARSFDRVLASFIVDIHKLRDINDAFGFHHGDGVLKEVGKRISGLNTPGAFVARMRGDEFALVCRVADENDAERLALQILDALDVPFTIDGTQIDVNSTLGISLYPNHGTDGTQLMRHADVALHEAKKSSKRYAFYRREQDANSAQRLALVGDLRRALSANELELYYQPKIDILAGEVCGVEALVRWNHPRLGFLPPDKFIGLAETSGLIRPLTTWVIRTALRQSSIWQANGVDLPVAVNLSPYNLRDTHLVETIQACLRDADVDAATLELEITEGAVMEDPEGALDILNQLRQMGITLFIDDFGTGYSSLGYLKRLPVNAVKIDKSFVIDMADNHDSEVIVRTTISLGHELGLRVVAEGVENRTALDHLAALGCDVAQGYFIAKPLRADDLYAWLLSGHWPTPHQRKQPRSQTSTGRDPNHLV